MREFGQMREGANPPARPGAYALIINDAGQLGVVRTPGGVFLPGGGVDAGESPESALTREVREECGFEILIGQRLGVAIQYVCDPVEGHFAKQCAFFRCDLGATGGTIVEKDHETLWLSVDDARSRLTHESQAWAVSLLDAC